MKSAVRALIVTQHSPNKMHNSFHGLLPVDKPAGLTSFNMVSWLRKATGVNTIGHAGTLDPFATGLLLLMVGKDYTRLSNNLMSTKKAYFTTLYLGIDTDSHDSEGKIIRTSTDIPDLKTIEEAVSSFQGMQKQIPPMFSAKKINGQKLYHLARKGIEIERAPVQVEMHIQIAEYKPPFLSVEIGCSKGTYIRSFARDLGNALGCGAHLSQLRRTQSGLFTLEDALNGEFLRDGKMNHEALCHYMLTFESEKLRTLLYGHSS